jgi:hypothetical protein
MISPGAEVNSRTYFWRLSAYLQRMATTLSFARNYEVHSQINASNYFFLNATAGMQIKLVFQALQVFKYLHPPPLYVHFLHR